MTENTKNNYVSGTILYAVLEFVFVLPFFGVGIIGILFHISLLIYFSQFYIRKVTISSGNISFNYPLRVKRRLISINVDEIKEIQWGHNGKYLGCLKVISRASKQYRIHCLIDFFKYSLVIWKKYGIKISIMPDTAEDEIINIRRYTNGDYERWR